MKSLGAEFEREREERAARVAESLKYIMKEDISAQTCCEGWDEVIRLLRKVVRELGLSSTYPNPLQHWPTKTLISVLKDEIVRLRSIKTRK